ncbi:MAG: nitroreductase family protein [Deltaproteobacteria bacterium]|nr:nitroreductase family protein [Deltaproteobacteria bacterium]MBW2209051.1 nitroreductase family protein [Deltaproteobacteria bacterium]
MVKDLIYKNRSYRRFHQDAAIGMETLRELVDLARHSASGANRQPLKYILSCDAQTNAQIFETLAWAGYLKDWSGPEEGERPGAYIVILGDKDVATQFFVDHGIACQTMLIGAVDKGLGGCIIQSINRERLSKALDIPDHFDILLVLALGKPKEVVQVDYIDTDGDIKYWRDAAGVHHVPKRKLEDIIVTQYGE